MEKLQELERSARLDKNEELQKNIFTEMTNHCNSDEDLINLQISLSRRRGQLSQVFSWFVSHNFQRKKVYYESLNQPDAQSKLIDYSEKILKTVVEGNLYLEKERIMISSFLKDCYEKNGDIRKAMDIVFEVPIETFSNVPEYEIIKYQLEQLRLAIANKDWIKAEVSSKKIRSKYFSEKNDLEREIHYLSLLIDMNLGQKMFYNASQILFDMANKCKTDNNYIIYSSFYALISDKNEERDNFFKKLIYHENNIENIRRVLHSFLKAELIQKEIVVYFKGYIDLSLFKEEIIRTVDVHNLCVISQFTTFISSGELCLLLKCDSNELVDKICYVVNNKILKCKISEDDGLIMFNNDLKIDWIQSVDSILERIVEANHLIEEEYSQRDQ